MMLEVEDKEKKEQRLAQEKADRDELDKILQDQDLTWMEKKTRARELAERKRRRPSTRRSTMSRLITRKASHVKKLSVV